MKIISSTQRHAGQALIVVLLVMAVILTSALSISSRSTLDVTTTTYETDALRAFSAAEAGVERALLTGASVPETDIDADGRVSYVAPVVSGGSGRIYRYPVSLSAGESGTVWFVAHDPITGELSCSGSNECANVNQMHVCWGDGTLTTDSEKPAIQMSLYRDTTGQSLAISNDFTNVQVFVDTADPVSSRTTSNSFKNADVNCPNTVPGDWPHHAQVNLNSFIYNVPGCNGNSGCLLLAKIKMLYNPTPQPFVVWVTGGSRGLPPQGYEIQSTGTAGESTRQINVLRLWPEPQSVFNNAIFSYNNLAK